MKSLPCVIVLFGVYLGKQYCYICFHLWYFWDNLLSRSLEGVRGKKHLLEEPRILHTKSHPSPGSLYRWFLPCPKEVTLGVLLCLESGGLTTLGA